MFFDRSLYTRQRMINTNRIKYLFGQSLPLFNALGDPVRQQLIMLMIEDERKSVAELAAKTNVARSTVSHHLKVLKDAHLIDKEKVGTRIFYFPKVGDYFQPMKELVEIVAKIEKLKGEHK
jgi:ArsR family transcriptional regulator, arsenate/arsenite/antimonite-responsive transcriptional repressor